MMETTNLGEAEGLPTIEWSHVETQLTDLLTHDDPRSPNRPAADAADAAQTARDRFQERKRMTSPEPSACAPPLVRITSHPGSQPENRSVVPHGGGPAVTALSHCHLP